MLSRETVMADAEGVGGASMRPPLPLLTCGASDTGKSTLIEGMFGASQVEHALEKEGDYRSFPTPRRIFLVAEMSGDTQGTRRLAAAASHAELALLVVDARKGVLRETRSHAIIASLTGVRYLVLAVNKIDFIDYDRAVFEGICESFRAFAGELGVKQVVCIPLCARDGDNVTTRSARTPWYEGPPLLDYLELVEVAGDRAAKSLRMSVHPVDASATTSRRFTGTLASGRLHVGDKVAVLPSGQTATIASLSVRGGNRERVQAGEAVEVTLVEALDIPACSMFAALRDRPQVADQFAAHLIWLSDQRLLPERSYLMNINDCTLAATVTNLKHRIDVESLAKLAARTLGRDEIGVVNLSVAQPIVFDPYAENRTTGGFTLLDRDSGEMVAVGMIGFALRRATNVHYQSITISKAERAAVMRHRPAVLWFTGLPAAGKSTIANLVEARLHDRGTHTILLDGDNIRHGLNRDLGFTEADRVENIRRIGEVSKLMTEAGLIVLCAFVSPFRAERRMVRELLEEGEFIEIFVDTPLEECIARDPKGLYRRALAGEIKNFTGVDQAYEAPENPELRLDATGEDADRLVVDVIEHLESRGIII